MVLLTLFSAAAPRRAAPSILRMQANSRRRAADGTPRLEFARATLDDVNELPPPPLPELKASLLARAADADRGFKTTDAERDVLRTLAAQLDGRASTARARRRRRRRARARRVVARLHRRVGRARARRAAGDARLVTSRRRSRAPRTATAAPTSSPTTPCDTRAASPRRSFGAIGALAGLRPATQYSVRARCRVLDEKRLSLLFVGGSVRSELALLRLGRTAAPPLAGTFLPRRRSPSARPGVRSTAASSSRRPTSTTRSAWRAPGRELWVLCKKDE